MKNIHNFNRFNESKKEIDDTLDSILDKILSNVKLSLLENEFLNSYYNNNEKSFFEKFKNKLSKMRYLDNLENGKMFDIIMANPKRKNVISTKEVEKINDNEFLVHSTTDGWLTAKLDKDEMVSYMIGEIDSFDLEWE